MRSGLRGRTGPRRREGRAPAPPLTEKKAAPGAPEKKAGAPDGPRPGPPLSTRELVDKVRGKIVRIEADFLLKDPAPIGEGESPKPEDKPFTRVGTGFIFDRDGHVLTNAHTLEPPDGRRLGEVMVGGGFDDRYEFVRAVAIGTDPASDLAVLRMASDNWFLDRNHPLVFTNRIDVGDDVVAIGFCAANPGTKTETRRSPRGSSAPLTGAQTTVGSAG